MNDDIKFLSNYISNQIFDFLKINLNDLTYEVIKSNNNYKSLHNIKYVDQLFDEYVKQDNVYKDDIEIFLNRVNVNYIRHYFLNYDDELDCWFRRFQDGNYCWSVIKMIKTSDYDDKKQIYLFIQDCDVPSRVEVNSKVLTEFNLLKAMTNIYLSMHVLDVKTNTFFAYKETKEIRQFLKTGVASEDFKNVMSHLITNEFKDKVLEFCDVFTLNDRLKGEKFISMECIGNIHGWLKLEFIPIHRDEVGNVLSAFFLVSIIDSIKKKEEKLEKLSHIDALTGLYNRYSYEETLLKIKDKFDYDVVVSVDINNLKFINDTYGHIAGDLIIKKASSCLDKVLSTYGKVFRTGGDEFVALINFDSKMVNNLIKEINDEISKIDTENYKLSLSIGVSSHEDNKDLSMKELIALSDKMMYENKEKYYLENKIYKYGHRD